MAGGKDITLNLSITGDSKGAQESIKQVVDSLHDLSNASAKTGQQAKASGTDAVIDKMAVAAEEAGRGFKALHTSGMTWIQFLKANMGPAMSAFGGHGPAINALGQQWRALKGATDVAAPSMQQAAHAMDQAGGSAIKGSSGLASIGSAAKDTLVHIGALVAAYVSFDAAKEFLRKTFDETVRLEQANARLGATFRATAGAAGLSMQALNDLAEEVSKKTLFDDIQVKDAITNMQVFTSVQGDLFKRAIALSADLAGKMGTDVSESARALGKALESPATGMLQLRRAGIILTESQTQQIKVFLDSGETVKAQTVLMDILEGKVGGLATAMHQGLAGSAKDAREAWDKFLQSVGNTGTFGEVAVFWLRQLKEGADALSTLATGTGEVENQIADRATRIKALQQSNPDEMLFAGEEISKLQAENKAAEAYLMTLARLTAAASGRADADAKAAAAAAKAQQDKDNAIVHARELQKPKSDAVVSGLDRTLAMAKEQASQLSAAAQASYEQGQLSLEAFFSGRRDAMNTEMAAELANAIGKVKVMTSRVAQAQTPVEKFNAQEAEKAAQEQVTLIMQQQGGKRAMLAAEEAKARRTLQNDDLEFQKTVAEAQGRTLDAALLTIQQKANALRIQLAQEGKDAETIAANIAEYVAGETAKAKLTDLSTRSSQLTASISNNEAMLTDMVNQGLISQEAAIQRQAQFVASQAGGLTSLTGLFQTLRDTTSDPAILAAIDEWILKLGAMGTQAKTASDKLGLMTKKAVGDAGLASLTTFFTEAADGAHSLGAAAGDMARQFISALEGMIAKAMALEVLSFLFPSFFSSATPVKKAAGGLIPGYGNSDTVPAMLTPGEFVLNKNMVAAMGGPGALERMRVALRGPGSLVRAGIPYFAGGGLVPAAFGGGPGGGDVTRVIIEAHPDLVVRQIESGPGSRAVIKAMKANKNAANSALGTGR